MRIYLATMRLRRRFRGWVMVWALLQFALPTAATYADALLERAGVEAQAHVESGTGTACATVHASNCALCQVVNRSVAGTAETCVLVDAVRRVPAHAPRASNTIVGDRGRLPLSRAPPAA